MPKVNLALIGFGNQVAKHHARYLVEKCSDKVSILAIAGILEKDIPIVIDHQTRLGITHVPRYPVDQDTSLDPSNTKCLERLFEQHPELDAAIISTPHTQHYYQVKQCLERKLHVLVDKPLAITYHQAKELVDLAKRQNSQLAVASQRRYEDAYRYAKRVIHASELGQLVNATAMISQPDDWLQGWRANPALGGGGALWSLGWHTIDTLVYLLNKKALAIDSSLYIPENMTVESHAVALILFEGNLSATITVNHNSPRGAVYERFQLWGTKGMMILERFKPRYDDQQPIVTHQMADGLLIEANLSNAIPKKWAPLEAFVKALTSEDEDGREPAIKQIVSSGDQSLDTIQIIEGIYESARKQERISLAE